MEINKLLYSYCEVEKQATKIKSFPFNIPTPKITYSKPDKFKKELDRKIVDAALSSKQRHKMDRFTYKKKKSSKKNILKSLNSKLKEKFQTNKENSSDYNGTIISNEKLKRNNFLSINKLETSAQPKKRNAKVQKNNKFDVINRKLDSHIQLMDEYSKMKVQKALRQFKSVFSLKKRFYTFTLFTALNEIFMNAKINKVNLTKKDINWSEELDLVIKESKIHKKSNQNLMDSEEERREQIKEENKNCFLKESDNEIGSFENCLETDNNLYLSNEFNCYRLKQKSFRCLKKWIQQKRETEMYNRQLNESVEKCLKKLKKPKNSLLLSQMFEIKEESQEYIDLDSPKNEDSTSEKCKNQKKRNKITIKQKLKKSEMQRQMRLKKRLEKIEALKTKKADLQKQKLEEEKNEKLAIRREIDDKIKEKRKAKKQNLLQKQLRKQERIEKNHRAATFYTNQLRKKLLSSFQKIAIYFHKKERIISEKIEEGIKIKMLGRLVLIKNNKDYEQNLMIKKFNIKTKHILLKKQGFEFFKNACKRSKKISIVKSQKFFAFLSKRRVFSNWQKIMCILRNENFWEREKNKDKIKRFKKTKKKIYKSLVFRLIKKHHQNSMKEKKIELKKMELRLKVDDWLQEFNFNKLR